MKATNRTPRLADEWSARIDRLNRLMETAPEWAWLWEIRLRVLQFLHSRYGETDAATRLPSPPAPFRIDTPPEPINNAARPKQWMSRDEMREILDDIHEIANSPPDDDADRS